MFLHNVISHGSIDDRLVNYTAQEYYEISVECVCTPRPQSLIIVFQLRIDIL